MTIRAVRAGSMRIDRRTGRQTWRG